MNGIIECILRVAKELTDEEKNRRRKKVDSVRHLATNIEKVRRKISEDLKSDNEKERLTAAVIYIMDKTAARVGNEASSKNGHHGVTGIQKKHVSVDGNTVILSYVGKSGVEQKKKFSNKRVAEIVKGLLKRCKSDSSSVFVTEDGFKVKADRVNRYLKQFGVNAKDLRGYAANRYMVDMLNKSKAGDEKERQKVFRELVKSVAEKVGHQAATLRKHYLLPNVESEYVKHGKIIELKTAGVETVNDKKIAKELLRIAGKLTPGKPDGTGPASGGEPQSGFGRGWCKDDDFDEEEDEGEYL